MNEQGTRVFHATSPPRREGAGSGQAKTILGQGLPDWMDTRQDLPCKQPGTDADWWFAPEGWWQDKEATVPADAQTAIDLCNTCPMQLDCREHGLRHERHGIWGAVRLDEMKPATRRTLLESLARERSRRSA